MGRTNSKKNFTIAGTINITKIWLSNHLIKYNNLILIRSSLEKRIDKQGAAALKKL